jgi:hypothetical protein
LLLRRNDGLLGRANSQRADMSVNDQMVRRAALSNAAIVETFSTVIGNKLIKAADDEPDTTSDCVYETSAVNFLPPMLFTLEQGARLERYQKRRLWAWSIHTAAQSIVAVPLTGC